MHQNPKTPTKATAARVRLLLTGNSQHDQNLPCQEAGSTMHVDELINREAVLPPSDRSSKGKSSTEEALGDWLA